jgi:hypothetical protein
VRPGDGRIAKIREIGRVKRSDQVPDLAPTNPGAPRPNHAIEFPILDQVQRNEWVQLRVAIGSVLTSLPSIDGSFSLAQLEDLVDEFIALGPDQWNTETNTCWAGKNYDKVAELIAIAEANGFSWASGVAYFVRGNNNASTSEAANAYGAMILYGLIVGDNKLVERGMYLHASTSAAY